MSRLPNNLELIDEGIPGKEDTGDTLASIVYKLNRNFQLILTQNDKLAGMGLKQVGRRIQLDQLSPSITEVEVPSQTEVDLDTFTSKSTLYIKNPSDNPQTLVFRNLDQVSKGAWFWFAYSGDKTLTIRLEGGLFLNTDIDPDMDGEIHISSPMSHTMQKLDDTHWLII
jgi:hypothetical protein